MPGLNQRSFAGGEVSTTLLGRSDLQRYSTGLKTCRNWWVMRSSGVQNRPGLQYGFAPKDSTVNVRLVPFIYSESQAYVLELGAGYIRVISDNARVLTGTKSDWANATAYVVGDIVVDGAASGSTGVYYYCVARHTSDGTNNGPHGGNAAYFWYALTASGSSAILEVPTPYSASDVPDVVVTQSADVMTFVHPSYPPYQFIRDVNAWTFQVSRFAPNHSAPTALAASGGGTGSPGHTLRYKVTAIREDTNEESLGCATGTTYTKNVTAAVAADLLSDLVVSHVAHPFETNDEIFITNVVTQTATLSNEVAKIMLESRTFFVTKIDADSFSLNGTAGLLVKPASVTAWAPITLTYSAAYIELLNKKFPPKDDTAIDLTWTGVADTQEYWIYRSDDLGPFGFVKATKDTAWTDDGDVNNAPYSPDLSFTPGLYKTPFVAGDWPSVTGYHQQRQVFAGTTNNPAKFWMSRTGDFNDFTLRSPIQEDDSLSATIAAQRSNTVQGMTALGTLLLFTDGGVWSVDGDTDGVVKPSAINLNVMSYVGANDLQPVLVDDAILFAEAKGSIVREMKYDIGSGSYSGYAGRDMTVFSTHLFDGYTITGWAYAASPHSIVWVIRSDGALLGLTYLREHEVWAWHRHDTGLTGKFLSVAVIPEDGRDVPYFLVQRVVNGSTVYSVERMAARSIGYADTDNRVASVFLDASITIDGTNATATTLTLTGGTTWAAGETGLTLTASGATFPGDTTNVGNGYRLVGADGEEVEVVVTTDGSTTVQTVTLLTAAPTSTRATATDDWVAMVKAVTGLSHLNGEDVYVCADLNVFGPYTVSAGAIDVSAWTRPYGIIHAGVQIVADLETLDVDIPAASDAVWDRKKRTVSAAVTVDKTRGLQIGTDLDSLYDMALEDTTLTDTDLVSDKVRMRAEARWTNHGRLFLRQSQPLPATVLGIVTHVEIGGR